MLNGPDAEPWDLIYFKIYKSQVPVIEQALETGAACSVPTARAATVWR